MTHRTFAEPVDLVNARLEGPSPAAKVALDMVKRGIWLLPVGLLIGAFIDAQRGAASVAYGFAIVLVNLLLSAALIGYSARISYMLTAVAAMFGFLIRLGLVMAAVLVVRDASWINLTILGITIIVTHLGLLVWELRYVSASLAFPGLKPSPSQESSAQ